MATQPVLIKDITSGVEGSDPDNLTNVNGTLFFTIDLSQCQGRRLAKCAVEERWHYRWDG